MSYTGRSLPPLTDSEYDRVASKQIGDARGAAAHFTYVSTCRRALIVCIFRHGSHCLLMPFSKPASLSAAIERSKKVVGADIKVKKACEKIFQAINDTAGTSSIYKLESSSSSPSCYLRPNERKGYARIHIWCYCIYFLRKRARQYLCDCLHPEATCFLEWPDRWRLV